MSVWRRTIIPVLAWQVAASVCFYSVFAGTQFVRASFDISPVFVGILVTALMAGYTVGLFPMGMVVDGYGEKRVMVAGLVGLSLAAAGIAVAPSYAALVVVAIILGGVYAVAMPSTNTAIINGVSPDRRNVAMGIKQVGVTAGSAVSAVVVTWFAATRFSWAGGFVFAAIFGIVVTGGFVVIYRRNSENSSVRRPDIRGLFARDGYQSVTLAGAFLGAGLFTTTGYTTVYVNDGLGLSPAFAGLVLAVAQVAGSAGRVIVGRLADKFDGPETRTTARLLLGQSLLSGVVLVAVPFVHSRIGVLVVFALLGAAVLGFTGIYYSCIGTLVPAESIGTATAGGQTALNAGAIVAPPVFGFIAGATHYLDAWLVLAGCTFVAVGILVRFDRHMDITPEI